MFNLSLNVNLNVNSPWYRSARAINSYRKAARRIFHSSVDPEKKTGFNRLLSAETLFFCF